jgi:hypothetical protein
VRFDRADARPDRHPSARRPICDIPRRPRHRASPTYLPTQVILPRLKAADGGGSLNNAQSVAATRHRDQGNDRQLALDLFDAFGSKEKTLHANMGGHTGVPQFEGEDANRFFARHLK